jgi:hypothetical protein
MAYIGKSLSTGAGGYIGTGLDGAIRARFIYSATAGQTTFSGNDANGIALTYSDSLLLDTYQNGVLLKPVTDYASTTGTSVVLVTGASTGDVVEMIVYDSFAVADTVSAANGGTFTGNMAMGGTLAVTGAASLSSTLAVTGDLTVDTNTLKVDSANNRVGIGTVSGANTLHVEESTTGTAVRIAKGGNYIDIGGSGSGTQYVKGFEGAVSFGNVYAGNTTFLTGDTERGRFDSSGNFMIGTTGSTPVQSNTAGGFSYRPAAQLEINGNNTQAALIGRTTDGEIIGFYSAAAKEGSISVSGTTVSYNGGHLARWSQLADNTKDTSIVKGTVMTNLDQMAVWHHEAQPATYYEEGDELPEGVSVGDEKTPAVAAYDEENEQLNCMAVSGVEGDVNVAGVFVNWDDDDKDYTADMNVGMTGDMVIRIAQGTTVERGDLLMSAGDGTAKPQGDDIVRSKTIAKVTSTTKSHTYDDGSYLMPCVLMAC